MLPPIFYKYIHPETMSSEPIRHPFRVGFRNAVVALLAVAIAAAFHLARIIGTGDSIALWVWPVAAIGIVLVCFAHALLGAIIGGKRANNVALIVLVIALIGIIYWVKLVMDRSG